VEFGLVGLSYPQTSCHPLACLSTWPFYWGKTVRLGIWGGMSLVLFVVVVLSLLTTYFLDVGFSARLWKDLLRKNSMLDPPVDWAEVVSLGIRDWRGVSLRATVTSHIV
jgi:hypothetical protein